MGDMWCCIINACTRTPASSLPSRAKLWFALSEGAIGFGGRGVHSTAGEGGRRQHGGRLGHDVAERHDATEALTSARPALVEEVVHQVAAEEVAQRVAEGVGSGEQRHGEECVESEVREVGRWSAELVFWLLICQKRAF